jgi:hypothetical protein
MFFDGIGLEGDDMEEQAKVFLEKPKRTVFGLHSK